MVNVVMFYLVINADAINEFLPRDNTDLLNWIELTWLKALLHSAALVASV